MNFERLSQNIPIPDFADGQPPPTEFLMVPFGVNRTTKGDFTFDHEAAGKIMTAYADRGIELHFDYEHQSLQDPPIRAPAAGWWKPAVRDNGLWATDIKWTPEADKHLRCKEYRYFSPALKMDPETGMPMRAVGCALTNLPAMDDIAPLMAAKAIPFATGPTVEGKWDGGAAKKRLAKWASSDGSGDKAKMNWGKYAKGFAYVSDDGENFGDYHLPHHDVKGGKLVVHRGGVMAAGAAVEGSRGARIPNEEMSAVKSHLAAHYKQFEMKAPWEAETEGHHEEPEEDEDHEPEGDEPEEHKEKTMFKTVLTAMNLKDDATEAEALSEVTRMKDGLRELLALTGATDVSSAKGTILALKASAEQTKALTERIQAIEGEKRDAEVVALVEKGKTDKKIPPAMVQFYTDMGKKDLVQLKAFLELAPALVAPAAAPGAGNESQASDGIVTLSEQEKKVCAEQHMDPAKMLERKKAAIANGTIQLRG